MAKQRKKSTETAHLLSTPNNTDHLMESIRQDMLLQALKAAKEFKEELLNAVKNDQAKPKP